MKHQFAQLNKNIELLLQRIEPLLPTTTQKIDWHNCTAAIWQQFQYGGQLQPINSQTTICIDDLKEVQRQWQILQQNTKQFIAGLPANHALLWGARGTGKSSIIHALLNEFAPKGLRLIEVQRNHLADLPKIVQQLNNLPQFFLIFCDDLSFESGEKQYRILKSVLDGSLAQAPENILLYATSNRRHLVPEKASDNLDWQQVDGEIHPSEAVEDKIALSDRFGLWLSFYPFNQQQYLKVVKHWLEHYAKSSKLDLQFNQELQRQALQWALERGNRSGRCANQFAKHWIGLQLLSLGFYSHE